MEEAPIGEIHPAATCGTVPTTSQSSKTIAVQVCPTTGGEFMLDISNCETIDGLKKAIHKKLKVAKERINVLHKDRILKDGTLAENNVVEGSRLTLLPNIESGLVSQKADNTVMQALENLSDSQVDDFLAGKGPLTLAMRLGDHMMFVQLQLSTSNAGRKGSSSRSARRKVASSTKSSSTSSSLFTATKPSVSRTPTPSTSSSSSSSETNLLHNFTNPPSKSASSTLADVDMTEGDKPTLNTAALAQASRNLSQKLRELSAVSSQLQKTVEPTPPSTSKPPPGAIIESMQHHGHGVYSGTFSGTLNPALQDSEGKPKKDVSTIIHILNDLLGAQPGSRGRSAGKTGTRRSHDKTGKGCKSKLTGVDKVRLNQENRATKGKMEQLRAMLEERRRRKKERQEAKTAETFEWEKRDRNGSDSSMTETEEMDIDANLEASVTDNVTDAEAAYQQLTHESSILA